MVARSSRERDDTFLLAFICRQLKVATHEEMAAVSQNRLFARRIIQYRTGVLYKPVYSRAGALVRGSNVRQNHQARLENNISHQSRHSPGKRIHKLPLRGKLTPSTALESVNQLTLSPPPSLTSPHGKLLPSSVSSIFFRISFLPPPVATKAILFPCVTTGSVSVILLGGGLGESSMAATHASDSLSSS